MNNGLILWLNKGENSENRKVKGSLKEKKCKLSSKRGK